MTMTRETGTAAAAAAWKWWEEVRKGLPLLRKVRGYTQRTLAARLGTTQGNVGQTEIGKYLTLRMPRLVAWLDALDLELTFEGPKETILIDDWEDETKSAVGRIVKNSREETPKRRRRRSGLDPMITRLRQEDLAELVACSKPTIQEIEQGRSDPRITTLAAVFIALGWKPAVREKTPATAAGNPEGDSS